MHMVVGPMDMLVAVVQPMDQVVPMHMVVGPMDMLVAMVRPMDQVVPMHLVVAEVAVDQVVVVALVLAVSSCFLVVTRTHQIFHEL